MENEFRVFVYPDGDASWYHHTPSTLITGNYTSEGYFFKNIRESTQFITTDPNEAHLFLIPIYCYDISPKISTCDNMTRTLDEYVHSIIVKYPYWNRTLGADHVFVTCRDIGLRATEGVPTLVKNSIRVMCSSSYDDVGYIPHKDVALPQVVHPFAGPADRNKDLNNRTQLFMWTEVGPTSDWEGDEIQYDQPDHASLSYQMEFSRARFCVCRGSSQATRIAIAASIHYGCVPVIFYGYYDLPFNSILDWRMFSLILEQDEIWELRDIIGGISVVSDAAFKAMHENILKIQKHFEWNSPPIKYDAFHMIMYDLWLRRHVIKY
ncbi:Exostosin domain-containing protein [Cephalotus follicularis]|uniref:Exostosin domain-containing protein n=1 Tax=Cephalotus follicularis TaxID=3775 RepID=A0A1Q3BNC7_CEPFO|nr:Exostosin domain-containing protein [Cephalotus follicularis]